MNQETAKKKSPARLLLGFATILALAAASARADAATPTPITAVNVVEYGQNMLLVQLVGGANYVAKVTPATGCSANAVTSDTLKAWLSMAQAAFLSGRRLKIYYTTCNTELYINTMDIWQ